MSTQSFDLIAFCHVAALDIQQHIVVVIVPRDCICRQGCVDVRHKVGITRKEKQTRGLDTHSQVYHLHGQGACACGLGTHSVSPTESLTVQASSIGLIQPDRHSQGLCRASQSQLRRMKFQLNSFLRLSHVQKILGRTDTMSCWRAHVLC